eukprot:1873139-Amphidinium_carterae.2
MAARHNVLIRVSKDGLALQYAPDELKSNRDIVLTAVRQNGYALEHASDELKRDREIVLAAVRQTGFALGHAAQELKNDHEIVLAAVTQSGYALKYATEELRSSRTLVMMAVVQYGLALEYAAEELRGEPKIVTAAIGQPYGHALCFAADTLLQDESFAVTARENLYFFRVTAMSGRSCVVASQHLEDREVLLDKSCSKLKLQRTGSEALLHGAEVVSDGRLRADSPGCPQRGQVVEYQLVMSHTASFVKA